MNRVLAPRRLAAVSLSAAVLLSACSGEGQSQEQELDQSAAEQAPTPMTGAEEESSQQGPDAEEEPAEGAELPQSPAGDTAQYVVDVLNADAESTPEDWQDQLHQDALDELSASDLAAAVNITIRPHRPWTVGAHDGDETQSVTRLEAESLELDLHIELDETDQLITTLFFGDVAEPVETAESFQEVEERLAAFPADVGALILQDGEPLLDIGADEPKPVASTAKLYVLLAAVEAIDAGETSWDQTLEVTDELRSLPSGTLQDQEEGFETSVYDVAHRMIEISDNTGTDMLIDHLGREAVEATVADAGHHAPGLLSPFLTTRELFQLRWDVTDAGEDWADADQAQRRQMLEELGEQPLELEAEDLDVDQVNFAVDWHASAHDIAAVHHELAAHLPDHPELESILGRNPGLTTQVEDPWWETVAFKGGSVPGVLTGSWHAVDQDGQDRTVVLLAAHDDAEELRGEADELFSLAQDALTIEE